MDRLAVSEQELIDKVDPVVLASPVKKDLVTGKFSKNYTGSGLAVTYDFDGEEVEIAYALDEQKGQPFSTEQEANSSDEISIFNEIIKYNLIIEAEKFYNT